MIRVFWFVGAVLAGCSDSFSRMPELADVSPELAINGTTAPREVEQPVAQDSTFVAIRVNGDPAEGVIQVRFWRLGLEPDTDRASSEFEILAPASLPLAENGVYELVGSISTDEGGTVVTRPTRIRTTPFNARIKLQLTDSGRVPILGLEQCVFELVSLDGNSVDEFRYFTAGRIDPSESFAGMGGFDRTGLPGGTYGAFTLDRFHFAPPMTSLAYTASDPSTGAPVFACIPRSVWNDDLQMPRYELVVGQNDFDFVLEAILPTKALAGFIEVRDPRSDSVNSFPLDTENLAVRVEVPQMDEPEVLEIRASATFSTLAEPLTTNWLPVLVVLE